MAVDLVHYAGLIHGFINLDNVFVGSRDAMARMSQTLMTAFSDEPTANRTTEVTDTTQRNMAAAVASELAICAPATLVANAVPQNHEIDNAPRKVHRMLRRILAPSLITSSEIRNSAGVILPNLCVRQTYGDVDLKLEVAEEA